MKKIQNDFIFLGRGNFWKKNKLEWTHGLTHFPKKTLEKPVNNQYKYAYSSNVHFRKILDRQQKCAVVLSYIQRSVWIKKN